MAGVDINFFIPNVAGGIIEAAGLSGLVGALAGGAGFAADEVQMD